MKLFFTFCFTFFIGLAFSQDVITQKNGQEIDVKIIGITDSEVTFYYYEDPDKVEVTMNRSLIREIIYEYGRKETEVIPGDDESYYVDDKLNNVKFNLTSFAGATTAITYERGINQHSSFELTPKIHGLGVGYEAGEKKGFGFEGGYKVHFNQFFDKNKYRPNHLLQDSYLKPGLGFTSVTFDDDSEEYNYFHGGVDAGKQWVLNNTISLDVFAGIHFYGGSYEDNDNCETCYDDFYISDGNMVGAENTAFRYGVSVGYLF